MKTMSSNRVDDVEISNIFAIQDDLFVVAKHLIE